MSKGTADASTFIRKSYYRARREYIDDDILIWTENVRKPSIWDYKRNADKKGVTFDLSNEDWNILIKGDCKYCGRTPNKWFGIDRVIPSLGYVFDNVVSCCRDCNVDKLEGDVDAMNARNDRIADRVVDGNLIINECEKVLLHNGVNKTSKKVYAYGEVYESKSEASRALGKSDTYVCQCIKKGWHSGDIFEITNKFNMLK
jgi:hypothetical protein